MRYDNSVTRPWSTGNTDAQAFFKSANGALESTGSTGSLVQEMMNRSVEFTGMRLLLLGYAMLP